MIGNDVVDLQLASRQSNWRRKGFLKKVFTGKEQEIILSSATPQVAVWLLWSMKEAAYKAHQRKFLLPRTLDWPSLECQLNEVTSTEAKGFVKVAHSRYFTSSNISPERVYSTAVSMKEQNYKSSVCEKSKRSMKLDFLAQAAGTLNLPSQELNLFKNQFGVPFLLYKNALLPASFSFSDHGKFSSFCLSLTNC